MSQTYCTECQVHIAGPSGLCPVCAPKGDILDRIDQALAFADTRPAGRDQAEAGTGFEGLPVGEVVIGFDGSRSDDAVVVYDGTRLWHHNNLCDVVPVTPFPARRPEDRWTIRGSNANLTEIDESHVLVTPPEQEATRIYLNQWVDTRETE